jgi:hypothetical protein
MCGSRAMDDLYELQPVLSGHSCPEAAWHISEGRRTSTDVSRARWQRAPWSNSPTDGLVLSKPGTLGTLARQAQPGASCIPRQSGAQEVRPFRPRMHWDVVARGADGTKI